jgi:hypothetical protein
MQAITTRKRKQFELWQFVLVGLVLAGIVATATTLSRQTTDDVLVDQTPVTVTFAIPQVDEQPVPGMPRDTFESITGAGSKFERPMGMPDYTWQEISG